MGYSKLLVVACSVLSLLAVPERGLAAAGPSSLGPSSGTCRLERVDAADRSLTECSITAGSDTAAVGGLMADESIIKVSQMAVAATPRVTFEGPGVSRSWDGIVIRDLVPVTPGERYTLTLNFEGKVIVTSGLSDADSRTPRSVGTWAQDLAIGAIAGIDLEKARVFKCEIPIPSIPEEKDGGLFYEATAECLTHASLNVQVRVFLHKDTDGVPGNDTVRAQVSPPYVCGPDQTPPSVCPTWIDETLGSTSSFERGANYYTSGKVDIQISTLAWTLRSTNGCHEVDEGKWYCESHGPHLAT